MKPREIKFRAWDKAEKKMYRVGSIEFVDRIEGRTGINVFTDTDKISASKWLENGSYDLLQWTGLRDKNGKEIFEGDILEIRTQSGRIERFTVEWGIHRRSMDSGWTVDIPSFAFVSGKKRPTFPIANNYLNGHDLDIIEVIGNIYSDPHLLTSQVNK
jgi:uncharacterized phage protein (TIGR01671 family)